MSKALRMGGSGAAAAAAAGGAAGKGATGAASGLKGKARLLLPAGDAKPGPTIGQSLGPLGLNMAEFCKQFNAESLKIHKPGVLTPARLVAYKDKSFKFTLRTPPSSWLLLRCAGLEKGGGMPGLDVAGEISLKQLYEVALIKQTDQTDIPLKSIARCLFGSARSMGIKVVDGRENTHPARVVAAVKANEETPSETKSSTTKTTVTPAATKPIKPTTKKPAEAPKT